MLADIAFRQAENAYLTAVAAANQPNLQNRDAELKRLFSEAAKRYQAMAEKYPEFAYINLARQGLGLCHHHLADYEKAITVLTTIPQADRNGPLATVPYVLADCLVRTAPTDAADALAAGRLQEQLGEAVKLLDTFLAAQPTSPQAPDALLKLGWCHQQMAGLLVDQQERNKVLTTARQAYEKLSQQFASHPLMSVAVFERAKCLLQAGDVNGGAGELNRFQRDPLKNTPIAPVALLRLATLQRSQGKSAEAVKLLELCRAQHEANLIKDPMRVGLAVALRYHHGLAIKETNKLPEARAVFESIVKDFANRSEVPDAVWCIGQCRREEAMAKLDACAEDSNESRRQAGGSERRQCGHSRRAEEPARPGPVLPGSGERPRPENGRLRAASPHALRSRLGLSHAGPARDRGGSPETTAGRLEETSGGTGEADADGPARAASSPAGDTDHRDPDPAQRAASARLPQSPHRRQR